jgi:hypothetical protein
VLSSGRFNFYLDNWSVVLSQTNRSLSFGHVQVPVVLELADVGRQMKGATGRAKLPLAGNRLEIQAFTGRTSRSAGLGITVMDAVGALAEYFAWVYAYRRRFPADRAGLPIGDRSVVADSGKWGSARVLRENYYQLLISQQSSGRWGVRPR